MASNKTAASAGPPMLPFGPGGSLVPWTELDHSNQVTEVIVTGVVFAALSAAVVIARIFIRIKKGYLWLDDIFIIFAALCGVMTSVVFVWLIPGGTGRHVYDIHKDAPVVAGIKALVVAQILYVTTVGLTKISLLLFLSRLGLGEKLQVVIYCALAFVTCAMLASIFGASFQCIPFAAIYNEKSPGGHCFHRSAFWMSMAAISIFSDCWIYLIPIKTLWETNLPLSKRLQLVLLFAMGGFVILADALRMRIIVRAANTHDPTYDNAPAAIWSSVQYGVGILVACLPALKPLCNKIPCFCGSQKEEYSGDVNQSAESGESGASGEKGLIKKMRRRRGVGVTTVETVDSEEVKPEPDVNVREADEGARPINIPE